MKREFCVRKIDRYGVEKIVKTYVANGIKQARGKIKDLKLESGTYYIHPFGDYGSAVAFQITID